LLIYLFSPYYCAVARNTSVSAVHSLCFLYMLKHFFLSFHTVVHLHVTLVSQLFMHSVSLICEKTLEQQLVQQSDQLASSVNPSQYQYSVYPLWAFISVFLVLLAVRSVALNVVQKVDYDCCFRTNESRPVFVYCHTINIVGMSKIM
jgi:hypothetical protein